MKNLTKIFLLLFFLQTGVSHAFDLISLWRHPEIAEKNSVFVDAGLPVFFFPLSAQPLPLNIRFDYLPPLPLPLSAGIFFDTPYPNLKSFGFRLGYHINIFDPNTDLFFKYSFNCGFILKKVLYKYNDEPPPLRFYDFGFGLRHFFSPLVGIALESGFKLESVFVSLSFKLN